MERPNKWYRLMHSKIAPCKWRTQWDRYIPNYWATENGKQETEAGS